jgi:hypothetical protein
MAETEHEDTEQTNPELIRLTAVLSLLGGSGLLERCESVSIGADSVRVAFHAPSRSGVTTETEPSKPKDPATRAREFEGMLREFLPGARIPNLAGGR